MMSSEHFKYLQKKFDNSSFSFLIITYFSLKSFAMTFIRNWPFLNLPNLQLWMTNIIISFNLVCFCSHCVKIMFRWRKRFSGEPLQVNYVAYLVYFYICIWEDAGYWRLLPLKDIIKGINDQDMDHSTWWPHSLARCHWKFFLYYNEWILNISKNVKRTQCLASLLFGSFYHYLHKRKF